MRFRLLALVVAVSFLPTVALAQLAQGELRGGTSNAARLQGKLLMLVRELDENVDPELTLPGGHVRGRLVGNRSRMGKMRLALI